MRILLASFLILALASFRASAEESPAPAPPADIYTIADVAADATADSAAHARDQALIQAEHAAYGQLCARVNAPDSAAKIGDDALAALVQSFDVQSERRSAVRYIGMFTIHFKPLSVQKKLGKYLAADAAKPDEANAMPQAPQVPVAHLPVTVQTGSMADWMQIKNRLGKVPAVARVDVVALTRGDSKIDLSYSGSLDDLREAVVQQGLVLRQSGSGLWQLDDGSIVPR